MSVESQVEAYSRVTNKCASVARVVMTTGPLAMGANAVVTVRLVMTAGPLARGADVVVEAEVVSSVDYFTLRSGVRCYRDSGEKIWMVGVVGSTG